MLPPSAIVIVYPQMSLPDGAPPEFTDTGQDIIRRTYEQCEGVNFVDLSGAFANFENASDIRATRYDRHPGAAANSVIANEIVKALQDHWPEDFAIDSL